MKKIIILLLIVVNFFGVRTGQAQNQIENKLEATTETEDKKEVVENPTLKTLSGSLNQWSFYSTFVYYGGSLSDPFGAERPNILKAAETPTLVNMSSNVGLKYRLNESDNFSFQLGLYSTAPFHSNFKSSNVKTQNDFDNNAQEIDIDDPVVSYFKTYHLGGLQNISFLKYQFVTRGIYRDFGLRSVSSYSHAGAYKINSQIFMALSFTYEIYQYDESTKMMRGKEISLYPYQTEQTLRGNLSGEFYANSKLSFRLITDIFSFFKMRKKSEINSRGLQQTLAATYFFNRDISIAPNVRFLIDDLNSKRTNVGLTVNLNI